MKKYLILSFIIMLLTLSTTQALPTTTKTPITAEFTHTIFAEESTATWCPNCPFAAEALYNIYQSSDYPFYYVALVDDMNPIAKDRNKDYSFGLYAIYAFPTVYFDGGDTNFVGRESTVTGTETEYRTLIEQEGQRTPRQPITLESTVTWDGPALLTITLTATNDGNLPYFGKLRSYVTEKESRWFDQTGHPYHFAFLDYAINNYVLLIPGKPKTLTATWDGTTDHQGLTYEDLQQNNTHVVSTISHWIPHYRLGYQSTQYTQRYFAFYADQTSAASPE